MAKQSDSNDPKATTPDGAAPVTPPPAPASPMLNFPNMSLDDPADDIVDVEEVLDDVVELVDADEVDVVDVAEEIPVVEAAAMDSAVVAVSEAELVADDEPDVVEVLDVSPTDSAVVGATPDDDALLAAAEQNAESAVDDEPVFIDAEEVDGDDAVQVVDSAVVLTEPVSSGVVSARVESPVPAPSGSMSDVDLLQMFEEEPAAEPAELMPASGHVESFPAANLSAVTGSEMPALAEEPISELSGQVVTDEPTDYAGQEPIPTGDGPVSEATTIEPTAAEPVSDVRLIDAGEIAPIAESPISDITLADLFDEIADEPMAEAVPASAVEAATPVEDNDDDEEAGLFAAETDEPVAEALFASAIEKATPANADDDDLANLFGSGVTAAVPASAVEVLEPISDDEVDLAGMFAEQDEAPVAEPAPASAVELAMPTNDADDDVVELLADEVAEAMPASAVEVMEPISEDDAADLFAEAGDEPVEEAMPASAVEVMEPISEDDAANLFAEEAEELVAEAMPASAVEVMEPISEDDAADLFAEAGDEPVEEAMPASAVEVMESMSEDDAAGLFAEEAVEPVEEAMPASAVEVSEPISEDDAAGLFAEEAEELVAEAMPASAVEVSEPMSEDDAADLFAEEADELVAEAMPASAVEVMEPISEDDAAGLFAEEAEEPVAEPASAQAPKAKSAVQWADTYVEASESPLPFAPKSGVNEVIAFADEPVAKPDTGPPTAAHVASDAALRSLFGVKEPSGSPPESPLAPKSDVQAEALPASDVPLSMKDMSETMPASGSVAKRSLPDDMRETVPPSEVVARVPAGDFGATIPLSGVGSSGVRSAAAPVSDILFPGDDEEFPAAATASAAKKADVDKAGSDVVPASSVLLDDAIEAVEEVAPASDVLFDADEEAVEAVPESSVFFESAADDVEEAIEDVEDIEEAVEDADEIADAVEELDEVEDAAPASGVVFDEAIEELDEVEDAAPASAALFDADEDEIVEAVEDLDDINDDELAEAALASDVHFDESADEILEAIEDEDEDEIVEAVEEIDEAVPSSGVVFDEVIEDVEEAAPASDVLFDAAEEEAVEAIEEAAPASDVLFDAAEEEAVEAIEEAAPASDVLFDADDEEAEEAVEAIEEAAPASDVLFDAAEEEVEEAVEAIEEADEAIEEADADVAVLASEDVERTEIGSSSVFIDDTIPKGSSAKKASAPASGQKSGKTVQFDQTIAFQPMSKASKASKAKKSEEDDLLVTEEELDGAVEASAVDLGEMPPPKGSSAKGIDKLAEALESGLDVGGRDMLETVGPEPSVVFDEILDDDSAEIPKSKGKGKGKQAKSKLDDGSTETDSAVAPAKGKAGMAGKNAKKVTKATGDDIDLDSMFEESDAEEAVAFDEAEDADALDADEAVAFDEEEAEADEAVEFDDEEAEAAEPVEFDDEEAEADEAFDADEAEAAEAFDADDEPEAAEAAEEVDEDAAAAALFDDDEIAPPKKGSTKFGKRTRMHEEEEPEVAQDAEEPEEAAAFEDDDVKPAKKSKTKLSKKPAFDDEDEDYSPSSKKGLKEKAVPAAAPVSGGSTVLRIFVGMFLMAILLGGGIAGAIYGLPDDSRKIVEQVFPPPPPPKAKPVERWVLARAEVGQGKYKEAADILKDASDATELGVRGEAVWLEYYGRQKGKPLDEKAPEVIGVKKDLTEAKATVLLAQIEQTFKDQTLTDDINKMKGIVGDNQKQLEAAKADKLKADKAVDALADVFVKGKYIDDKAMFDVTAIEKILKSLGDDKTTLEMVNKLLEDAKIKDKGDKGVAEVITDRNAVAKDRDDVLATLAAAFKELIDGKVVPDKADARKEIVAGTKKLTKDRDDLFDTLSAAFKELVDGKIVPEKADARKEIVAGTKLARQKAESPLSIPLAQLGMSIGGVGSGASKIVEQTFDMAKVFSELGYFKTREPFIQTPEQKLDTYITLLQDRKQNNLKELDAIRRETDWVDSKKSRADDEARTKARFVLGLTLRNEERFADARTAFEEAAKMLKDIDKPGPWSTLIAKSHREIVDPTAYFMPRIDKLQADGKLKDAIDEANLGLKAMPEEARLFAQRGLLRFETIRGKGAKLGEVAQKAIREDAEAAAKDEKLVAESAYILGLLEEELGNLVEAEKQYRQALKMHQGLADDAGRYRVALARLLLRDRPEVDAPAPKVDPDAKKKDDKAGARLERDIEPNVRVTIVHPLTSLVVAAIIGQPVPEELEDKETLARLRETIKIAEELINETKNPKIQGQGYLLRGSARSKLGDRTAGLKDYATGLKLLYPGIQTAELTKLIEDHPAFQQPDSAKVQNPVMAERHFGEGIHYYWAGNYPQAEIQFKQAVKYFERDARYQYYLGLAMLQQRTKLKRDAAFFAFDKGAQLEAEAIAGNPFVVRDINQSLERIQGELRQFLNGFRYKTQGEAGVK